MLGIEFLVGLGREGKAGIEGKLLRMAVLEVLEVLVSAWQQR